MLENRWFTKTGNAKRIGKEFEPYRQWANDAKNYFMNRDVTKLVLAVRVTWPDLSLVDATNLMVYLVGCYSNAVAYGHGHVNGGLFRSERYDAGKLVSASLQLKAFDIRKLELVS